MSNAKIAGVVRAFAKDNMKPSHTPTLMQLPETSVPVPYLRSHLGQLHDREIDYIVRCVNAYGDLMAAVKAIANARTEAQFDEAVQECQALSLAEGKGS